ncbi:Hypothetical predicted protein [Mytilus galloprovincialis]|uniref:Uncharacterized protein n=1 Tax=Mytilus galloprovincialis TaxID=29158 RepID=A0A8B6G545_MYTGA|nr:Hypothetical predicted protein [Mytilus galloprovincialis]
MALTDTINPNISIELYRYLCHNIVGSEDHVKRIRIRNAVWDNIESIKDTIITSGSFGEGLEMRGSDLDMMFVLNDFIEVWEDKKSRFNPKMTYLFMESEDVKPGYTLLNLEYSICQEIINDWYEHNGKQYFSSTLHKQRYLQDTFTIHGPCILNKDGTFDGAIS